MPIPNDLLFGRETDADGTMSAGDDSGNPVVNGIDFLDGSSVISPIDVKFSSALSPDQIIDATSFISMEGHFIPNPNQNVFLLPLEFPGGDALQQTTVNGQSVEVPAFSDMIAYQAAAASANIPVLAALTVPIARAELLSLDGGTNNVLRINPLQPLKPETKYLLVVTGLKDANGNPVYPSIAYDYIKNPNSTLNTAALESVRGAIQGWEQLAGGYFAFVEQVFQATGLPIAGPDTDDIIFSMTLTTTATDSVLKSVAAPAFYFEKSLRKRYKQDAIRKLVSGVYMPSDASEAQESATDTAINNTLNTLLTAPTVPDSSPNPLYNPDIAAAVSAGANYATLAGNPMAAHLLQRAAAEAAILVHDSGNEAAGDQAPYVSIAQEATGTVAHLTQASQKPVNELFPLPASRPSGFYTAAAAEDINPALVAPAIVYQGQIKLPVYQKRPTDTDGTNITSSTWEADTDIGSLLGSTAEGGATPPSTKVTYRYPFPAKQAEATVPLLATLPSAQALQNFGISKPEDGWPVVIFVHGITSDRSTSLPMANAMAFACVKADLSGPSGAPCFATVTIDHPLHGVAPKGSRVPGLTSVSDPAHPPQGLPSMSAPSAELTERHYNYQASAFSTPIPMNYADGTGTSGSLFINLQNFANSRDSMRQMILDLLNLNASLADMDVDGDGLANDLDTSRVYVVGHSLGAINALTFVAINNSNAVQDSAFSGNPLIRGVSAIAPGGGLIRVLVNSPAFAPEILPKLAAASADLAQGTSGLETFLSVFQGIYDSADAINFVTQYKGRTGLLISEFVGDGNNHPADLVISPASDKLWGDAFGPLQTTDNDGFNINSTPAPLSGTEPLIYLSGALKSQDMEAGTTPEVMATRYSEGSHNTAIVGGNTSIDPLTSSAVFNEILQQTITLFAQDGIPLTGSPVSNSSIIAP